MADLNPPAWRGAARSTFQHWEFRNQPPYETLVDGTVDARPINPEIDRNPYTLQSIDPLYQRPWLIVRDVRPSHTEWLQGFAGKTGVWRVEPKFRIFGRIPNAGVKKDPKKLRVQMTYFRVTVDPDVTIDWIDNPDSSDLRAATVDTRPADNSWTHRTWDFELTCTAEQTFEVTCDGVVYIDQIVIDTVCPCEERQQQQREPHQQQPQQEPPQPVSHGKRKAKSKSRSRAGRS